MRVLARAAAISRMTGAALTVTVTMTMGGGGGCGSSRYVPPADAAQASPAPAPSAAPAGTSALLGPTDADPVSGPAPKKEDPAPSAAPAAPGRPSKISARHVLIQWMGCERTAPSVVRTREQAHAVALDVLARAKAGEDFARLAVEYSDEPNAGARGGSLGRFGHGQMVKSFEEAAFALAPGEISGIVESSFGFHIIQRTE